MVCFLIFVEEEDSLKLKKRRNIAGELHECRFEKFCFLRGRPYLVSTSASSSSSSSSVVEAAAFCLFLADLARA